MSKAWRRGEGTESPEEPGGNRGVRKHRAATTAHQQVWVGKWRGGPGRHGCWAVARRKGGPGSGGEGNPVYLGAMSPLVSGKEGSGVERWREVKQGCSWQKWPTARETVTSGRLRTWLPRKGYGTWEGCSLPEDGR